MEEIDFYLYLIFILVTRFGNCSFLLDHPCKVHPDGFSDIILSVLFVRGLLLLLLIASSVLIALLSMRVL